MSSQSERQNTPASRKFDLNFILDSPASQNQPVPRSQPVPRAQPPPQSQSRTTPHYLGQGDTAYAAGHNHPAAMRNSGVVTPDGRRGHPPSNSARPSARSSSNSSFDVRQPSAPSPLPPPRSSAKRRAQLDSSYRVISSDGTQYIYCGHGTGMKRNVLQRVEEMAADINIRSFDAENIVCAGCGYVMLVAHGSSPMLYDNRYSAWKWHQMKCLTLQGWQNPSSPRKLSPEEQGRMYERSRMASLDNALAYLEDRKLVQRL
ncbi:hypothetical protein BD626DRAFT_566207 [Schizophyllum amplum]|uniref:Uncharacterized protein n=1 Tax=Schizophyllum amplum TaxID=97359 RepID=A0A550CQY0_9AGAR|nr:hypothetical protein BD626DRAFT_566207 [Auriculariopsis ampla]